MTRMSTKNRKYHQETRLDKMRAKHAIEVYRLKTALANIRQFSNSRSIDGRRAAAIAEEALTEPQSLCSPNM